MAKTLCDAVEVGKRVYRPYSPAQAGVIMKVYDRSTESYLYTPPPLVWVKWVDGSEGMISSLGLNDFDALIEDHQKKLNMHLATLTKLEALIAINPSH